MRRITVLTGTMFAAFGLFWGAPTAQANPEGVLVWDARAPVIPAPPSGCGVEGAAGSVIDETIYVSHGYSCGDTAVLRIYDIVSDTWILGPPASVIRSELAGAAVGGLHYAIGGRPAVAGTGDAVEIFDPVSGTWFFGASMPTPRAGFCAAVLDGQIHAIGGRTGSSPGTGSPLTAHEIYDPVADSWSAAAPLPIAVLDNYACVELGGFIYVFGGQDVLGITDITQIYNSATDSWSLGAPMPTPRSNAVAGVLNCHPVVVAGYDGRNLDATEVYHPDSDTWTIGPPKPTPASEIAASMPASPDAIHAVGSGIFGISAPTHEALVATDGFSGCFAEVDIDIQVESEENVLNLGAEEIIPVGILGSESLDVNDVVPATLAFGPAGAPRIHENHEAWDVNEDGFPDKVFHFRSPQTGIAIGDTEACLTGELVNGRPFEACDFIQTRPACGLGFELAFLLPPLMWFHRRRRNIR